MRSDRLLLPLFAALLGAALFGGAAASQERGAEAARATAQAPPAAGAPSDQAALRERATAYWKARVARDKSVFDYYPPEGKRIERGQIPEFGAVRFDAFEIEGIEIEGDIAMVTVKVESHIDGKTPFPIPDSVNRRALRERWDRIDGVWYKQAVVPALRAAAADLQRAFERRRAAEEESAKAKDAGSGAPTKDAGADPGVHSGP